ncbi:alpha/beta fold hydrolase [Actinacidiphila sp. bgisy167]|uniref:alpha/beta fold hydrolase n=1 Tax=Actinacidiphila sp. bgisy167 TaxID=3413797 RepID=UPI003D73E3F5
MAEASSPGPQNRRRIVSAGALAAALAATGFAAGPALASAVGDGSAAGGARPTVVLVHGAFADASSWSPVIERLEGAGYKVVAPANPLRGLVSDSLYTASVLKSIDGPVVLAGHSYGGAVISAAAAGNPNVRALVYVSAFMPEAGETLQGLQARFAPSDLGSAQRLVPYQDGSGSGTDVYIRDSVFRKVFAADLPAARTRLMAAEQRPIALRAFTDKAPGAAWRTIPSWALVAADDHAINPALERFQAKRAGSHTTEVASSHVAMLSHPDTVARMIREAADSTASDAASGGTASGTGERPSLADTGPRDKLLTSVGGVASLALVAGAALVAAMRQYRQYRRCRR